MRLQKFLAHAGIASRRKAEELISAGKVSVNGEIITVMGYDVAEDDIVKVDGKIIAKEKHVYYLLNKPLNYLSTVQDQRERATVVDLMQDVDERVYPVGRLDSDSAGLLLMTNDGDLAYIMTHPRFAVWKSYQVEVNKTLSRGDLMHFRTGLDLDDGPTLPAQIEPVHGKKNTYSVSIREGRKRQIRRMFKTLGFEVLSLTRITMGPIKLGDLQLGKFRKLNESELSALRELKRNARIRD